MVKQIVALDINRVFTSLTTPQQQLSFKKLQKLLTVDYELRKIDKSLSVEAFYLLSDEDLEDIMRVLSSDLNVTLTYKGFPKTLISRFKVFGWSEDKQKESYKDTTVLYPMSLKEILSLISKTIASPVKLNTLDQTVISRIISQHSDKINYPKHIPLVQNRCLVMSNDPSYNPEDINDILSFGFSRDNYKENSLSLPRKNRKKVLEFLEKFISTAPDDSFYNEAMSKYGGWITLSERLHPGDYKDKYPKSYEFFTNIKAKDSKKKYRTWNSRLFDLYILEYDIMSIIKFVSERRNELAYRFNGLMKKAIKEGKEYDVLNVFMEADNIDNTPLLNLLKFYDNEKNPYIGWDYVRIFKDHINLKLLKNIENRTKQDLVGKKVYLDPILTLSRIPREFSEDIPVLVKKVYKLGDNVQNVVIRTKCDKKTGYSFNTNFIFNDSNGDYKEMRSFTGDLNHKLPLIPFSNSKKDRIVIMQSFTVGDPVSLVTFWIEDENKNVIVGKQSLKFDEKIYRLPFIFNTSKKEILLLNKNTQHALEHNNMFTTESLIKVDLSIYDLFKKYFESRGATITNNKQEDVDFKYTPDNINNRLIFNIIGE